MDGEIKRARGARIIGTTIQTGVRVDAGAVEGTATDPVVGAMAMGATIVNKTITIMVMIMIAAGVEGEEAIIGTTAAIT